MKQAKFIGPRRRYSPAGTKGDMNILLYTPRNTSVRYRKLSWKCSCHVTLKVMTSVAMGMMLI